MFNLLKTKNIMKYFLFLIIGIAMSTRTFANPLLEDFKTPFGVPAFDKFKTSDYLPAFKEAMKLHNKDIQKILKSKDAPNFENTIVALDRAGSKLVQVSTIFFNLNSVITDAEMDKVAEEVSPLLSAHYDKISLNADLFKRIKQVYDNRATFNLNAEQNRLLEKYYKDFVRNGALLDDTQKAKLMQLNEKLSKLTIQFAQNVQKETNSFQLFIDNKADLAGLPQSIIDGAAEEAKAAGQPGKWLFTLQNPSIMPFLQYSSVRPLREKIWKAYANRGNNGNEFDNGKIAVDIANLRMERAKLLGYDNHSAYILETNMAKNPKTVLDLLYKIWEPSIKVSKLEAYDLQSMIFKEGNNFKLEPWDWSYYSEKVRKAKYDLNEEDIRPYFKLENVREGIFTLVNKLYGVTFKQRNDLPLYHPEVISYEVFDADGSHLGILYMDFFPRDSKRGGAWMTNYREQYYINDNKVTPVVSLVLNFSKPTGDQPSLLTLDEVQTFFHEFGHGLHGLFSNCHYLGISGTNVSRDFVELPSQIMEHWATEPELLKLFAKHYKTGEVIPQSLIDKIDKSSKFNQGFATVEYLAAAFLDIFYHTIESPINVDANKFENDKLNELGLIPEIISRYRSQYFRHAFSGGYDSGYYSYIWSGVLDSDAFEAFKQNGIFDKKTATAFRKNVLERGNTDDPQKLYKLFRGADPSIEPLLKNRGLN